jgi:hypothetical protein
MNTMESINSIFMYTCMAHAEDGIRQLIGSTYFMECDGEMFVFDIQSL